MDVYGTETPHETNLLKMVLWGFQVSKIWGSSLRHRLVGDVLTHERYGDRVGNDD